jgi:hypothetical protein
VNIGITITVGSVMIEASAQDCGPDACSDMLRQATLHMLTLVDKEACAVAARRAWDDTSTDEPDDTDD